MKPRSTESSHLLSREPELERISRRDRRAFAPERERRCIAVRLFSRQSQGRRSRMRQCRSVEREVALALTEEATRIAREESKREHAVNKSERICGDT